MTRNALNSLYTRRVSRLVLCLLVLLVLFHPVLGNSSFWLSVERGNYPGSECLDESERQNAFMVGMIGTLVITIDYPDSITLPYRGVQDWTWPQGMMIEAAISDGGATSHFQPSAEVFNRLNLMYFVLRYSADRDSLWRFAGIEPPQSKMFTEPKFWFHLDLAGEWAGKYLCMRAHYVHPAYGDITSEVKCFNVSAPCSKADSALALRSNIVSAGDARDYARALALTDSLLATGWTDRIALRYARSFARAVGRFDDELRYMDIQFERYGNIGYDGGEEVYPVTAGSREAYEGRRQELLRKKAEYEQQQHK